MENENQMLVTMTKQDLDDLVYYTSMRAAKRALDKHFRGILPFFNKMNDDLEMLIREQEYIKLLLQDRNMNNFEDEES